MNPGRVPAKTALEEFGHDTREFLLYRAFVARENFR